MPRALNLHTLLVMNEIDHSHRFLEHLAVRDFDGIAALFAPNARARLMLPRGRGCIFFTGATASVRGGIGYAAFAGAKSGLRAVAQSMARELGPKNIHVAHLIIDAGVDTAFVRERIKLQAGPQALDNLEPDQLMNPASVAEAYWQLYRQSRDAWTFELDVRPYREGW